MKQITRICLLLFLSAFFSCKKFPYLPGNGIKEIKVTIVDNKGTPVRETHSSQVIRIISEEFRAMNQNGSLKREGKVLFNNIAVPIRDAQRDYIEVAVPIMRFTDYTGLLLSIRLRELTYRLLYELLYRPTVTGEPFAGLGPTAPDGTFQMPAEMALDSSGNLYVIDQRGTMTAPQDVILKVTPTGSTSLFTGSSTPFGRLVGIGIDPARNRLYVSDATSQQVKWLSLTAPGTVNILAGSGTAGNTDGTGPAASFRFGTDRVDNFGTNEKGQGMALDAAGNIYVGERWGTQEFNSQIRRITPAGVVTTVTGSRTEVKNQEMIASPSGVSVNAASEPVYVSGASGFFQGVTRVSTAGVATRIAGQISYEGLDDGTGAAAQFSYPKAITFFSNYHYVADGTNGALRRVSPAGEVITLAGVGHFRTPRFCACGPEPVLPSAGSYIWPPKLVASPDPKRFEELADAIRMDQVGGVAVRHRGLMYLSDHGLYKCIWRIRIE